MADELLEQQRTYHEQIDRLRKDAVKELASVSGRPQKEKVHARHRVMKMCETIADRSTQLVGHYGDADGTRAAEIKALSGPDEFAEFYTRLKGIRERHRRFAGEIVEPISNDIISSEDSASGKYPGQSLVEFSGEEGHGRFLDLHAVYDMYLNLGFVKEKIDYTDYILTFDRLFDIPKKNKNAGYKRYLEALIGCLTGFYSRANPLENLAEDLRRVETEFGETWTEGTFPGWPAEEGDGAALEGDSAPVSLDDFASAKDLEAVGLDRLKATLTGLGLKAGGNIEQRAERLFMTKGKSRDQWPKGIVAGKGKKKAGKTKDPAENRSIGLIEAKLYRMAELLGETRQETRENVERKQARTAEELLEEEEEADAADFNMDDDEDEEDEEAPYNPKGLPLGWDGKPIPYWLYKLHGLNVRYECEICGNYIYRGPKAFQQHFKEWRHAHGMRCLGIPNTIHFTNITKIKDALELWERLKTKKVDRMFSAENEEEFEDSNGNVFNKKTYEDLKRQDLL